MSLKYLPWKVVGNTTSKKQPPPNLGSISDEKGLSYIHCAAATGRTDIVALLVNYGTNPLHQARHQAKHYCPLLLFQLDERTYSGQTALHFAAKYGHLETIRWILGNGSRAGQMSSHAWGNALTLFIHQCVEDIQTPDHVASAQSVIELLLQAGCAKDQMFRSTRQDGQTIQVTAKQRMLMSPNIAQLKSLLPLLE